MNAARARLHPIHTFTPPTPVLYVACLFTNHIMQKMNYKKPGSVSVRMLASLISAVVVYSNTARMGSACATSQSCLQCFG